MQQVTRMHGRAFLLPIIISLLLLFTAGCGWNKTMMFRSPSGQAYIEVWQTGLANEYGIRVDLVTKHGRTELFERRGESLIYLVHVYWSPQEDTVGILATGAQILRLAFDLKNGKPIPFDQIREELAESIRKTYKVPVGEKDPVGWAALADAQSQFWQMHPEIRVTYHEDSSKRN